MRIVGVPVLFLSLSLLVPAPAARSAEPAPRQYAPSCVVDFSSRLEAPAGRRGFLFVGSDGHFYFPDGTRARFWGLNVAKYSVFQSKEVIDRACDAFARAGFNLVRLHHVDDLDGLYPPSLAKAPERFDRAKLDALDYWIHALRRRGIYVMLDLLDYRTFTDAEGVVNGAQLGRGAKPAAFFNEKIIQLQMDFARELFATHVNPHTGLRYADDPAICMLEICDENGLLATRDRWGAIPSPYREELLRRWNYWLRQRYTDTANLKRAWTLAPFENLEKGTVSLPGISPELAGHGDREPDVRCFAAGLEREFLAQMAKFLRSLGVKVPISAVTDYTSAASVSAAADSLDFLSGNYYFAHPSWRDNQPPDVRFFYTGSNPVADLGPDTAVRRLSGMRVAGKPLVIREWNVCWPNAYRAPGLLETAALSAVQDVDAMILFCFYTEPQTLHISPFDVSNDPSTWGLVALAGEVFRQNAAASRRARLAVVWDPPSLYSDGEKSLGSSVFDAGRQVLVENWFPGHAGPSADLYALMGPSARGSLPEETRPEQIVPLEAVAGWGEGLPLLLGPQQVARSPLRYSPTEGTFCFFSGPVVALGGRADRDLATPSGDLRWTSGSLRAALVWVARDGLPPATSRDWIAKMVAGAWNSGEMTRPHFLQKGYNIFALVQPGTAPVSTGGKPGERPTVLTLGDRVVLQLFLRGGVWELVQQGATRRLYCDTPGLTFEFPDLGAAVPVAETEAGRAPLSGPPWVYPPGARFVEVGVQAP